MSHLHITGKTPPGFKPGDRLDIIWSPDTDGTIVRGTVYTHEYLGCKDTGTTHEVHMGEPFPKKIVQSQCSWSMGEMVTVLWYTFWAEDRLRYLVRVQAGHILTADVHHVMGYWSEEDLDLIKTTLSEHMGVSLDGDLVTSVAHTPRSFKDEVVHSPEPAMTWEIARHAD